MHTRLSKKAVGVCVLGIATFFCGLSKTTKVELPARLRPEVICIKGGGEC